MRVSPARRAAFEILRRIDEEDAYSSALLARADDLNAKDRALCHELVLGVLRRQLWLDLTLEHFAAREVHSLDLPVVIAMRLGLYQLRFLSRIPASAAINESVNLVKTARVKSAAPFVNAILRRATREPTYDPAAKVSEPTEQLAIETSHPRWLLERWVQQFGVEEAAAIARANNEPAATAFRLTAKARGVNPGLDDPGAGLQPSSIVPECWRVVDPPVDCAQQLRRLAAEGLIYFQDEASQLVAHLVAAQGQDRVLDVCAAPGSKSSLIAALAPKARIVACDLHEHRLRTTRELAELQGATKVDFLAHDATFRLPFAEKSFGRVLVDAPCSGTGTLRHNPEIRWRLKPADIAQLVDKQKAILHHASAAVKAGGLLVYSTCSIEREENEEVASDFLKSHGDFEIAKLSTRNLTSDAGFVRTWPHHDQTDGFFVTGFRRKV
jgi:16S rRNA (cytosine967-C5)-methyltransferase